MSGAGQAPPRLVRLREVPGRMAEAAAWFSGKWGIPAGAYLESMRESLAGEGVPQWYVALDAAGAIVAGAGVIENDFHDRPDLRPNLCALFVEPAWRGRGIAGRLLALARRDMGRAGLARLYLVTDHLGFYERYGWAFLCMVRDERGVPTRLYAAPTRPAARPGPEGETEDA